MYKNTQTMYKSIRIVYNIKQTMYKRKMELCTKILLYIVSVHSFDKVYIVLNFITY